MSIAHPMNETLADKGSLLAEIAPWRLARLMSRWAAAGLVVTSCACSTVNRPVASTDADPFLAAAETPAVENAATQSAGRAAAERPRASRGPVVPVSHTAARSPSRGADRAVVPVAAEARMPLDCPACPQDCPTGVPGLDERFPDEYLCDGGDRGLPVHYNGSRMAGLETEDTVVEFRDDEGKRRVKPANKVCIYAPRFASVVSVSGSVEDVGGGRPTQAVATVRGVGLKSRDGTAVHEQKEMTERFVTRLRGSSLLTGENVAEFDRPEGIQGHIHTTTPLVSYTFLQTGQVQQREGAWLAQTIQSASVWTRDQNPVIVGQADSVGELRGRFNPLEFVGRENRFNGKGKLRIVKLADKDVAEPGDVITFKIRFDNIGDREVNEVVIVDNLTPRLEYVEDSATCDRNGQLVTEDNGEGSLILRWELAEPLPGRSGGVVTFQARVR